MAKEHYTTGIADHEVIAHMYSMFAGQCGLTTTFLDALRDKVIANQLPVSTSLDLVARSMLRQGQHLDVLSTASRSTISSLHLPRYADLLHVMLQCTTASTDQGMTLTGPEQHTAELLRRRGYLDSPGELRYCFPSPMHMQFYRQRLYMLTLRLDLPEGWHTFDVFLVESIRRMRAEALNASISWRSGDNALYERQYQMEWYRAACTCLPHTTVISADVGACFDKPGRVDFWVEPPDGGTRWAVELLRESSKASEHARSFQEGGKYHTLPFTDYALLNFCDGDVVPTSSPSDKMLKVNFVEGFKTARIYRGMQCIRTVQLATQDIVRMIA